MRDEAEADPIRISLGKRPIEEGAAPARIILCAAIFGVENESLPGKEAAAKAGTESLTPLPSIFYETGAAVFGWIAGDVDGLRLWQFHAAIEGHRRMHDRRQGEITADKEDKLWALDDRVERLSLEPTIIRP